MFSPVPPVSRDTFMVLFFFSPLQQPFKQQVSLGRNPRSWVLTMYKRSHCQKSEKVMALSFTVVAKHPPSIEGLREGADGK